MTARRKLLTIGHSYAVRLNRKLADAVARRGWDVTAAGPSFMHGDLRPIPFEPDPDAAYTPAPVRAYLTRSPHAFFYGLGTRELLRRNWDVVHCWEEPFVVAGAQVARWTPATARLVYYSFQNLTKRYPPPFAQMERYALRRAAGWVAGGQTVSDVLAQKPAYAGKPNAVIPLGVDPEAFHQDPFAGAAVRRSLGWNADGPPVVGYLGRFLAEKGLPLLTRTLDGLRCEWRALFVGGGPWEPELRAFAAKHPDRVRIATGVPHDRVPDYLNAMDLLAAPSQTTPKWKEQLGRMLIEAFACRVAVVASDSGEIPFVVGDAGAVLPEADEPAWAETLGRLLTDPAERARLAAAGFERANAEFVWDRIAEKYVAFFDRILSIRYPAPGADRP